VFFVDVKYSKLQTELGSKMVMLGILMKLSCGVLLVRSWILSHVVIALQEL